MIVEAAPQPSNFTATFIIKVNAIRTTSVGDLTDVVKQVEWTMVGTEAGKTFELPQTTTLQDPDGQPFIPLANLTETQIASWIEATDTRLPGIKAHIQLVLDREIAKDQLQSKPLPWAPVVEPTQATEPASAT